MAAGGCQHEVGGQDEVEYYPPGPEFTRAREEAESKKAVVKDAGRTVTEELIHGEIIRWVSGVRRARKDRCAKALDRSFFFFPSGRRGDFDELRNTRGGDMRRSQKREGPAE
jgi:hypothetical protein